MATNVGHELDGDTVGLWRMDEASHQDYSSAADETGNYPATQSTNLNKPSISIGPGGTDDYSRWFIGMNNKTLAFTPDATMIAAFKGNLTIEAWIYLEGDAANSSGSIITLGGSGETEAANYLAHPVVNNTGKLGDFWEHGAGTDESHTQVAGATIALRTWTYVAWTYTVSSGDRRVDFFIDSGTSQDNGTGTNASGGAAGTTDGTIGLDVDDTNDFNGAIARIRISNVVRSGTELNDNATDPNFQFPNDGNTLVLWDFQEVPDIKDISDSGFHLHPSFFSPVPRIVDPHVMDGGKARSVDTTMAFTVYQREELRLLFLGEYTLELWCIFNNTSADRRFSDWGGSGENEETNFITRILLNVSGGNYTGEFFGEEGAGTDTGATGSNTVVSDNTEGSTNAQQRHHFAFVIEDAGGGQRNMLVYLDAALIETIGPYNVPTGGTDPGTTDDGLQLFSVLGGEVDDTRLSDVARTITEIQDSFNRGFFNGQGGNVPFRTVPEITRTIP